MKIERIQKEIDKTISKIEEQQSRLRDLQRQKTEAENTEIVSMVRSIELTPQELAEFIKVYRESGKPPTLLEKSTYPTQQEDIINEK